MRPTQFSADTVVALLREQTVAALPDVMAALGPRVSRRTAFRKLKDLEARTSYSHRGGYYTLDEFADFDDHGLWAFAGVRFSRAGTLVATAEAFVNDVEAGHFVDELDNRLGVGTQDALRKLVGDGRLTRHKLAGQFLYCGRPRAGDASTPRPTAADGHARTRAAPARRRPDARGVARRHRVVRRPARRAPAPAVRRTRIAQVRVGRRPAHRLPPRHRPVDGRHRPPAARRARCRGRPGAARGRRTTTDGKKRRKSSPASKP